MGRRNLKNDKENNDQEKRTKILTMIYNATSAGGLLVPEGMESRLKTKNFGLPIRKECIK
jgi:hypothetical protein